MMLVGRLAFIKKVDATGRSEFMSEVNAIYV